MAVSRREDLPHPREVAAALAERVLDVCRYYLRGGERAGGYWQAGDVTGAAGQSLYVHLSGPRVGRWRDAATGDHGDLLDLIRLHGNHATLGPALREARAFLGGRYDIPEPRPSERAAMARVARAGDPERIERFLESAEPVRPDNAAGRHLAGRGLTPELAAETLLYHPRARVRVDGALVTSPAILAPIRTPDGRVEAVHRIFITEDGGPAKFAGRKRNSGSPAAGGVWFGAEAPERVVICEGIEDALAIYGQLSESGRARVAVVASASADRIAAVDMPATVRDLVLFRDLDEAGARSWQALEARWRDAEMHLVCIAPDGGKDANDILLSNGAVALRRQLADALGSDVEGVREARTDADHEGLGRAEHLLRFVENTLVREMEGLGATGVHVRLADGRRDEVRGRYLAGVVEVALAGREEMFGALRHEVIHALRDLGALEGRPWEILENQARREWMDLVDDRYAKLPEEQRVEEAVAAAYRLWYLGELDPHPAPKNVFEALRNVFRRVGEWCRGFGWKRAETIFEAIENGEFIAHPIRPDVTGKPPVRIADVETMWGGLRVAAARKAAAAWAKENVRGRYVNDDTDWNIGIGRSGTGKATRKWGEGREDLEIVRALPALLKHAVWYENELPLDKSRADSDVRAYHHFLGAARLDGELRQVRLTVREFKDGRRFYDHCTIGKIVPLQQAERERGQAAASALASARDTIDVGDLFAGVQYRNGEMVLEEPARKRAGSAEPRHMFAPADDLEGAYGADVPHEVRERVAEAVAAVERARAGRRDLLAEAFADDPPEKWLVELGSYGGWRRACEAAAARVRGVLDDPRSLACLAGMAGTETDLRDALDEFESRLVADDAAMRARGIKAAAAGVAGSDGRGAPERAAGAAGSAASVQTDGECRAGDDGHEPTMSPIIDADEALLRQEAALERDVTLRKERKRMYAECRDSDITLRAHPDYGAWRARSEAAMRECEAMIADPDGVGERLRLRSAVRWMRRRHRTDDLLGGWEREHALGAKAAVAADVGPEEPRQERTVEKDTSKHVTITL